MLCVCCGWTPALSVKCKLTHLYLCGLTKPFCRWEEKCFSKQTTKVWNERNVPNPTQWVDSLICKPEPQRTWLSVWLDKHCVLEHSWLNAWCHQSSKKMSGKELDVENGIDLGQLVQDYCFNKQWNVGWFWQPFCLCPIRGLKRTFLQLTARGRTLKWCFITVALYLAI